jgi:gliding motility-associated-like protein
MSIYNRWGELIYTTDNKDEGWDGTANGLIMQAGTYVYVISYEVPDYVTKQGFTSPVTGRVNLLR